MRTTIFVTLMMGLICSTAVAKSSVGDWQAVQQNIPRGWQIVVVTSMTFPCIFEGATDDELICGPLQRDYSRSESHDIHVARERIREIRVEKRNGANALAGAAAVGLAGAGFGALAEGGRGATAYLFGMLGSAVGGHTGGHVHILRGKVIYRRP